MPAGGGGNSGGSNNNDRTTFVGVIVPRAIKNLPKHIAALPDNNEVFKSILDGKNIDKVVVPVARVALFVVTCAAYHWS